MFKAAIIHIALVCILWLSFESMLGKHIVFYRTLQLNIGNHESLSNKDKRAITISVIDGSQIVLYGFYLISICVMKYLHIDDRKRLVGHLFFMNTIGLTIFAIYGIVYYYAFQDEIRRYYLTLLSCMLALKFRILQCKL